MPHQNHKPLNTSEIRFFRIVINYPPSNIIADCQVVGENIFLGRLKNTVKIFKLG
jgi:hypothetical protein